MVTVVWRSLMLAQPNKFKLLSYMMDTKKKTQTSILNELKKLKCQQKYLEATQKLLDFGKKFGIVSSDQQHITTEVNHTKDELNAETEKFKNQNSIDVQELVSITRHFKDTMLNDEGLQQFDTKQYRDQIIYIDQKFREMLHLNTVCLTDLKRQYADIESRLSPADVFLREVQAHSALTTPVHYAAFMRQVTGEKPVDRVDNADVKRFLDYLVASNGHNGGWMDEEHNLFLKLKRKYGDNLEQISMSFRHIVYDKTNEDIEKHDRWYSKYVELKQRQKAAIQNWKCNQCIKQFHK